MPDEPRNDQTPTPEETLELTKALIARSRVTLDDMMRRLRQPRPFEAGRIREANDRKD